RALSSPAGRSMAVDGKRRLGRFVPKRNPGMLRFRSPKSTTKWNLRGNITALGSSQAPRRPIFFQGDTNQLAARPHSGLDKELLQRRLHRSFRNVHLRADLLVAQSREYSLEHLALPLRQFVAARLAAF